MKGGGNRQGSALAFLRITIGILFLFFAEYKLVNTHFIRIGMATYIRGFIAEGSYPFIRPFLQHLILPWATFWGAIVAATELLIGLSLVFGVIVRWAKPRRSGDDAPLPLRLRLPRPSPRPMAIPGRFLIPSSAGPLLPDIADRKSRRALGLAPRAKPITLPPHPR